MADWYPNAPFGRQSLYPSSFDDESDSIDPTALNRWDALAREAFEKHFGSDRKPSEPLSLPGGLAHLAVPPKPESYPALPIYPFLHPVIPPPRTASYSYDASGGPHHAADNQIAGINKDYGQPSDLFQQDLGAFTRDYKVGLQPILQDDLGAVPKYALPLFLQGGMRPVPFPPAETRLTTEVPAKMPQASWNQPAIDRFMALLGQRPAAPVATNYIPPPSEVHAQRVGNMVKDAANSVLFEPGMELGETLKRIADGQASPIDYVDAGMGAAGAVPAARAVSAMTGMTSKITNLVNRLKPQLRAGFADNMLASRNANLYNPLDKRIQAFEEDYRAGAHADETGRLTRDSEGRDLTAPFVVGRRTLQGADVPLGAQEVESVAKAATGKEPTPVARTEIGGYAGSYQVVRDRRSGRVLDREIFYDKNASPKQQERIIAHELSHAIDEIAGRIPTDDIKTDLKRIYNTLNTGQERTRNLTGPQHFGYRGQDIDKELVGEAIRAYMANPNYLKSVAPRVAARIREYVNPHPELSKIIQFNALGGAVAIPALSTNDGGQQ